MAETANRSRGSGRRVRGAFAPEGTNAGPQPDIIEHFGNADAVPQLPERCLSRKAGIVRCCLRYNRIYCRPLSGTIPKGRHLFSGWRAHDVRPLRGARQITADFYGKTKSLTRQRARARKAEKVRNYLFFSSSRRSSISQTPSIYSTPSARSYLP